MNIKVVGNDEAITGEITYDVPIDVISKMLGHTNVRMTQVYAMVTQDKLFEEADKFIEATKDFVLVLNANKCLKEYLMSIGREDMSLADVTLQLGKDYHIYLRQKKHLCPATANGCLAWLSRLVFLAVDKEILRSNPLEDIEYEKVKRNRNVEIRYLTREQVKMLLAHPFQQRQMKLARHMLLFTVFTGLAYVDLTRLRTKDV